MDYNQSPIQSYTQYSYKEVKQRQRAHAFYSGHAVLMGYMAILVIMFHFMFGASYFFTICALALCVLHACQGMGVFYTRRRYAEDIKPMTNGQWAWFRNHDLVFSYSAAPASGHSTIAYSQLHGAYETKAMIYLYLTKSKAYLIAKQGLQANPPEELRALLQYHLGKKYKKSPFGI